MREYWCDRLEEVQIDAYHNSSWDQQFWMFIWLHYGKGIIPNVNLSTNIGFDEDATHPVDSGNVAANRPVYLIMPLGHSTETMINKLADRHFQKLYFEPWAYGWSALKRLPSRLNKLLKRLVGHEGSWFKRNRE